MAVVKLRLGFCANIQRTRVAQRYATVSSSRSRTSRDSSSYDPQRRSISRILITQMPIRVPSLRVTSILVHISLFSWRGEQWRHYGYGPRHRTHRFLSTPGAVLPRFSRKLNVQWLRVPLVLSTDSCLGRALLINRGAITRDLSRIAFSFFLSLRFLFRIYIFRVTKSDIIPTRHLSLLILFIYAVNQESNIFFLIIYI